MTDDLPTGTCIAMRQYEPAWGEERVIIEQADPRILITEEMATKVIFGEVDYITHSFEPSGRSLFTIHGYNRKLIYRVLEYLPDQKCYLAEWPD